MRDKELYRHVLGLPAPWDITNVELNNQSQEVVIKMELTKVLRRNAANLI